MEITPDNLLVYKNEYEIEFINTILKNNNLQGIRIFAIGKNEPSDYSFLQNINNLKTLSFFDSAIGSFDFLYELKSISKLHIQTPFAPIDFGKLSQIKELSIHWNKNNLRNLQDLKKLKTLSISEFNEDNFILINSFPELQNLRITISKIKSVDGLEKLVNLQALSLRNCTKLKDFESLSNLQNLEFLELNLCREVTSLSNLSNLQKLKIVELIDCKNIESLVPLKSLPNLEQVSILGTTKIKDNDLLPVSNIERVFGGYGKYYNLNLKNKEKGKRITFGVYLNKVS